MRIAFKAIDLAAMLFEPPPSPGDIHFRVLGFPVRIHPFFWVTVVILGLNPRGSTPPLELLIWVGVALTSILVHELGHAIMQRRFGGRPWIVLHGFGGLAVCDDCDRSPSNQVKISLAGPIAGFIFALAVIASLRALGHSAGWTPGNELTVEGTRGFRLLNGIVFWTELSTAGGNWMVSSLLQVNILWGLINLLPVYPLDGGQISRELFTLRRPRQGIVRSLQLSIATAVAMSAIALLAWQSLFTAILFGYLAYSSYRTLQSYQAGW